MPPPNNYHFIFTPSVNAVYLQNIDRAIFIYASLAVFINTCSGSGNISRSPLKEQSYVPHCKLTFYFYQWNSFAATHMNETFERQQEVHPSCRWQSIAYIRVDKANSEQIRCRLMIRRTIPYKNTLQELTMKYYLTSVQLVIRCHYLLHYRCNILYQLRLYSKNEY
jgi:hypothetical protein